MTAKAGSLSALARAPILFRCVQPSAMLLWLASPARPRGPCAATAFANNLWCGRQPTGRGTRSRMAATTDQRIRDLTARMLRKKFYAVFSRATAAPDAIKEVLPEHLEYMIGLEKK